MQCFSPISPSPLLVRFHKNFDPYEAVQYISSSPVHLQGDLGTWLVCEVLGSNSPSSWLEWEFESVCMTHNIIQLDGWVPFYMYGKKIWKQEEIGAGTNNE